MQEGRRRLILVAGDKDVEVEMVKFVVGVQFGEKSDSDGHIRFGLLLT